MKKTRLNFGILALALYILMTYIATDILIPSVLCTVSIGVLVIATIGKVYIIRRGKIKKGEYGYLGYYA